MITTTVGAYAFLGRITKHNHSICCPSELERPDMLQILALHQYLSTCNFVNTLGRYHGSTLHNPIQSGCGGEDIFDTD